MCIQNQCFGHKYMLLKFSSENFHFYSGKKLLLMGVFS